MPETTDPPAPATGSLPPNPPSADAVLIMDAAVITATVRRMAEAIVQYHPDWLHQQHDDGAPNSWKRLALVGIQSRGVEIARRLAIELAALVGADAAPPAIGSVDISMHRDDLQRRLRPPAVQITDLPLDLDDRDVILTDDVFFTGRTIRAALDALRDFGRPRRVQLAVLIERTGHRELPIRPDFTGESLDSAREDRIRVRFQSIDAEPDAVWLRR